MERRPISGDTDDDLLSFQTHFLNSHTQPSAKIMKVTGSCDGDAVLPNTETGRNMLTPNPPGIKTSKKPTAQKSRLSTVNRQVNVMSEIVEKDTGSFKMTPIPLSEGSFPVARPRTIKNGKSAKTKKSIFAQEYQKAITYAEYPGHTSSVHSHLPYVEKHKIHDENVAKLASMSQEEILTAQRELIQSIDPKLLDFIKSRKSRLPNNPIYQSTGVLVAEMDTPSQPVSQSKLNAQITLPLSINKNWLHMDDVEEEKLLWMQDLPPPVANDSQTGQSARFDFDGNFVLPTSDVPVNRGLHHHGDEPNRAGYTLEELIHLARSSNHQQRSFALRTITSIIRNESHGRLIQYVATPILSTLLEAGLMFLLRWALDDNVDSVVVAAVGAIHAVIVNDDNEECVDMCFSWFRGEEVTCRSVANVTFSKTDSDIEVLDKDLLYGLVHRMNILIRFEYLIMSRRLQPLACIHILTSCIAIAQHSVSMSYEIMKRKKLIQFIVISFLPLSWKHAEDDMIYDVVGCPLPLAMKLFRVLCQSSRHIASSLIVEYSVMDRVIQYLALHARDISLPLQEAVKLQLESYRLWTVCLRYGLTIDLFVDFIHILMGKLHDITKHISSSWRLASNYDVHLDTELLAILESSATCLQGSSGKGFTNHGPHPYFASIDWRPISGFAAPIITCLSLALQQTTNNYQYTQQDLGFAASCMNFLATLFTHLNDQVDYSGIKVLDLLEKLWSESIHKFMSSSAYTILLSNLISFSNVRATDTSMTTYTHSSLPRDPLIHIDGQSLSQPIVRPYSPYNLVTSLFRLLSVICKINKSLITQVTDIALNNTELKKYLAQINHRKLPPWIYSRFTRTENMFHYFYLKLSSLRREKTNLQLHSLSLHLLARLVHGDEHIAHDLLSTVIFNPHFLWYDEAKLTVNLSQLNLSQTPIDTKVLLLKALDSLTHILPVYLTTMGANDTNVQKSRNRFMQHCHQIDSLFSADHMNDSLLPMDWLFLPVMHLYNQSQETSYKASPEAESMTLQCLKCVYMLEILSPSVLSNVSTVIKLTRLMCVYFLGSNIFLDGQIQSYIRALLIIYTTDTNMTQLNLSDTIHGIKSFSDFYQNFIENFEGESFGDALFSNFLLIPILQKFDHKFKMTLWGDHTAAFQPLHLPLSKLIVSIQYFLTPDECNEDILRLYVRALLSNQVTEECSPILYIIAVHHSSRYMYLQDNLELMPPLKSELLSHIKRMNDCVLKKHLIFYKSTDHSGLQFYQTLPPIRQKFLEQMKVKF